MWEEKQRLVIDTSVCIDIFNGDVLGEVVGLPYVFLLPDVIIAELENPPGVTFTDAGFTASGTAADQMHVVSELSEKYKKPSRNDVFALATAKGKGLPLLTGDKDLRNAAKKEKVEVHGTIWILDRLVEESILPPTAAVDALEKMLAARARLPAKECEERLKRWRT